MTEQHILIAVAGVIGGMIAYRMGYKHGAKQNDSDTMGMIAWHIARVLQNVEKELNISGLIERFNYENLRLISENATSSLCDKANKGAAILQLHRTDARQTSANSKPTRIH